MNTTDNSLETTKLVVFCDLLGVTSNSVLAFPKTEYATNQAPLFILMMLNGVNGTQAGCIVSTLLVISTCFTIGLSSINLFAMTWERYVAIFHPYRYPIVVTKTRLLFSLVFGFGIDALLQGVLVTLTDEMAMIYIAMRTTILFFFTAFVYSKIYVVVRRLIRIDKVRAIGFDNVVNVGQTSVKWKVLIREVTQAKSCFLIVACFFTFNFLPALSLAPVMRTLEVFEQILAFTWIFLVMFLNSSFNSIIFFWAKKLLRKEASKIFGSSYYRKTILDTTAARLATLPIARKDELENESTINCYYYMANVTSG
ncbi:uncharacterized protein LOC124446195 [Xenia sp. Carnegie-2017]|uniref:uncharacterized protein LOC124446195 n=1 Tax=Xenia sp. Carnegie-2017 TaxID=2897299 RepID=UPI001F0391C1|nr:uncharacterized protein LOC124446195 [Xenia sp. Carnegie-2017]